MVFALDSIQDPVSLYEPVYHDGGDAIFVMDQVSDEKNLDENWIEEIALREAMRNLNDREKHILNLRFYEGRTQMEVAQEMRYQPGTGQPAGKVGLESYEEIHLRTSGTERRFHRFSVLSYMTKN